MNLPQATISVSHYLHLLNDSLHQFSSTGFFIEGEISDFRIAQNKWVSFDLKDEQEEAVLKCFMTVWQLQCPLEDGMKVHIIGYPKVYERFGTLKLNVEQVELVGEGALRRAYELLKKKLAQEGLFDATRKRSLPRFISRIGLITSPDAAAYGDFIRVLMNRWGGITIVHAPVHVQGREAVSEILGAFRYFNELTEQERPEVLVLTRGGGGLEDLHAFNDEQVARALFQSKIPVVCAVGHERDESLCDFVADVRASTPSNAAERLVPDRREILYEIETMVEQMEMVLLHQMDQKRRVVESAARAMSHVIERQKESLVYLQQECDRRFFYWMTRTKERLMSHTRFLSQVDPKRVLSRGYSLVRSKGKLLREANLVDIGTEIQVELANGFLDAEILRVNGIGKQKLL